MCHTELLKPSFCHKRFELIQWPDSSNLSIIITILKKNLAAQFLQRHTIHNMFRICIAAIAVAELEKNIFYKKKIIKH